MSQNKSTTQKWLIFIDTNVLLALYSHNNQTAVKHLKSLAKHKDSLIMTEQVWMEFLKNRQNVILRSIKNTEQPTKRNLPKFVDSIEESKKHEKSYKEDEKQYKNLIKKMEGILLNPKDRDIVYQNVKEIFQNNSRFNLRRPNKIRFKVRHKARKRFSLGYPPRKNSDTSIGDAYNWEWIIECAATDEQNRGILIVTMDKDFGMEYKKKFYLNDWLKDEFDRRVGKKRKIEITNKTTDALKKLHEPVSDKELKEEIEVLKKTEQQYVSSKNTESFASLLLGKQIKSKQPTIFELFEALKENNERGE